ncbi:hypothetical protein M427DRAFT_145768 [Gonapodya prolifera JEL478]|uniref:Uncharacterized protein n=1 Tax=Gonapodya prolifera (strain JEL478) TaxID=1344416 RepID=A0A139ADZ1_GONPJ|nr:hypothetical protein M427DRAFT_145768 [Gonapodya prolifera JEL478]|eukprot:KXS15011.1 hypothetical protein M427DRAFT_145768 [Gonapodya prolifera JEL478]
MRPLRKAASKASELIIFQLRGENLANHDPKANSNALDAAEAIISPTATKRRLSDDEEYKGDSENESSLKRQRKSDGEKATKESTNLDNMPLEVLERIVMISGGKSPSNSTCRHQTQGLGSIVLGLRLLEGKAMLRPSLLDMPGAQVAKLGAAVVAGAGPVPNPPVPGKNHTSGKINKGDSKFYYHISDEDLMKLPCAKVRHQSGRGNTKHVWVEYLYNHSQVLECARKKWGGDDGIQARGALRDRQYNDRLARQEESAEQDTANGSAELEVVTDS